MMMAPAPYPGLDSDDMATLAALASVAEPPPFEEAYGLLEYESPKDVAERAYADFVADMHAQQ